MTHINAYIGDLEEKKAALVKAQGDVDAADLAVKAHPDYVAPKQVKKVEEPKIEDTPKVKKPTKDSVTHNVTKKLITEDPSVEKA